MERSIFRYMDMRPKTRLEFRGKCAIAVVQYNTEYESVKTIGDHPRTIIKDLQLSDIKSINMSRQSTMEENDYVQLMVDLFHVDGMQRNPTKKDRQKLLLGATRAKLDRTELWTVKKCQNWYGDDLVLEISLDEGAIKNLCKWRESHPRPDPLNLKRSIPAVQGWRWNRMLSTEQNCKLWLHQQGIEIPVGASVSTYGVRIPVRSFFTTTGGGKRTINLHSQCNKRCGQTPLLLSLKNENTLLTGLDKVRKAQEAKRTTIEVIRIKVETDEV